MVALTHLALQCYPTRLDYVDRVFEYIADKIQLSTDSADLHSSDTVKQLMLLLKAPIQSYDSALILNDLDHYATLLRLQPYGTRRSVAHAIIASLLSHETVIETVEDVQGILGDLCSVMIRNQTDENVRAGFSGADDSLAEEQGLIARVIHLLKGPSPDEQFLLLSTTRKILIEGGGERMRYTFPPLAYAALKLARDYFRLRDKQEEESTTEENEQKSLALFRFLSQVVGVLSTKATEDGGSELALRLYLHCAQVADQCEFEQVAYDFFVQVRLVWHWIIRN